MPRVGREVVGLYLTRKEAEDACSAFIKSRGDRFRPAFDDCIVELVLEADGPLALNVGQDLPEFPPAHE
jgi:hypothetical protein